MTGEVALCLMLLVCAGLLLRGTARLTSIDFGFDMWDVHVIGAMDSKVPPEVETALREQSWVEAVAQMDEVPTDLEELWAGSEDGRRSVRLRYNGISPGYLQILRIPLLRGRGFTQQEVLSRAPVAIISEGAARSLWQGEDPVGKVLRCGRDGLRYAPALRFETATVIGVTRERGRSAGTETDGLTVYFPSTSFRGTLLLRGRGDPQETGRRIERLLGELRTRERVEVSIPLESYRDLDSYAARAGSWLASVLGSLALLLTVAGMFGVMSFLVGQRMKEMGVRLALGATGGMVVRLILLYSARLVAYGVLVGIVLALWGAKLIAAKTQFIALYDLPTYLSASTVVALGAIAAALGPALRAATVDPVDTLRAE